ncbi:MAG: hypothetical protein SO135_03275 [Sphaerochaetaceae bacterium]|nr:hypothetical protein [Sphaerochaetaceae bacterium]NLY07201.1 hypothetical protein [Spirochaetales bacterium]
MKKAVSIIAFLTVALSLCAAPVSLVDIRSDAMGGLGMACYDSSLAFYHNPASMLFGRDKANLSMSGGGIDGIDAEAFSSNLPNPFLSDPASFGSIRFVGRNAALSITLTNMLVQKSISDDLSYGVYDALNVADLQLTVAYGWPNFSFGFTVNGGNCTQRENISIYDESTFLDYMMQTLFERYAPKLGSEFVSLSLGMMGKLGDFSIGLTFDEFTSVNDDKSIGVSLGAILSTMCFGFHYTGQRYDRQTAGLIFVVPSFGIEVHNVFLESFDHSENGIVLPASAVKKRDSGLCIGGEVSFQLSPILSIAVQTGLASGGFSSRFVSGARQTFGFSVNTEQLSINLAVSIPFEVYMGHSKKVDASLGMDFSF